MFFFFFFSSRRRHTRWTGDWSSDVCSSDLATALLTGLVLFLTPFAVMERVRYARRDGGWIAAQVVFDATDGVHFGNLVARANRAGDGRMFAGRRPSKSSSIGAVPGYAA